MPDTLGVRGVSLAADSTQGWFSCGRPPSSTARSSPTQALPTQTFPTHTFTPSRKHPLLSRSSPCVPVVASRAWHCATSGAVAVLTCVRGGGACLLPACLPGCLAWWGACQGGLMTEVVVVGVAGTLAGRGSEEAKRPRGEEYSDTSYHGMVPSKLEASKGDHQLHSRRESR